MIKKDGHRCISELPSSGRSPKGMEVAARMERVYASRLISVLFSPKNELEAAQGSFIACAIKGRAIVVQGAKQAIEKKETDSKVCVHQSLVIDDLMVEVVPQSCRKEPASRDTIGGQPNTLDMHEVMEIAEHQKAPAECDGEVNPLVRPTHVKDVKHPKCAGDQQRRGHEPLDSDISERDRIVIGRVVIFVGSLLLQWAVKHEVMAHVIATQKSDHATVQKPVQPIAE